MASSKSISLKTSDGVVFRIEPALVKKMKTVQTFIDKAGIDADVPVIPLNDLIFSRHVTKIIEYHTLSVAGKVEEFSVEKLNDDQLKEFFLVAHYLNMESLFQFLSQAVADRIQNKSVEYMRKFLGVENDFTLEEEAALREKYGWAFED